MPTTQQQWTTLGSVIAVTAPVISIAGEAAAGDDHDDRPRRRTMKINAAYAALGGYSRDRERATTANLNDVVRFRIRRDRLALFADNPDVRIPRMPCDPTADVPAEAQLHALIRALAPHIGPTLDCPIHTDIEMLTG